MRIKTGLFIFVITFQSGCSQTMWIKPGMTESEFEQDAAKCEIFAIKNTEQEQPASNITYINTYNNYGDVDPDPLGQGMANLGRGFALSLERERLKALCLKAKGYVQVTKE